jgi:signal transduction histidine kinase
VVADTGCGIPARDLERIFEPFVTTKLGRGGTGLGLAISADIVRHHGGELVADSRPGEGATFTLTLPLEPARRPAAGDDGESGAVESPLS